jgi:hypothetical protein
MTRSAPPPRLHPWLLNLQHDLWDPRWKLPGPRQQARLHSQSTCCPAEPHLLRPCPPPKQPYRALMRCVGPPTFGRGRDAPTRPVQTASRTWTGRIAAVPQMTTLVSFGELQSRTSHVGVTRRRADPCAGAPAPRTPPPAADVDGTLIHSAGPRANRLHKEAFSAAFAEVFEIDTNIDVVPHHGSTDPLILIKVLQHHGVDKAQVRRPARPLPTHPLLAAGRRRKLRGPSVPAVATCCRPCASSPSSKTRWCATLWTTARTLGTGWRSCRASSTSSPHSRQGHAAPSGGPGRRSSCSARLPLG